MAFSLFGQRRSATSAAPAAAPVASPAAPAAASEERPSPLAAMADAWKMDPVDPSKPAPPGPAPYLQADPAKLAAAAKNLNFMQGVDPEMVSKAMSGDAAAFAAVLNQSNQNSFQAAMLAIPSIVEPALHKAKNDANSEVPSLFRQMQIRSETTANPIFGDAAVAPILEALKHQLAAKNPQSSAKEIQATAESMMVSMAGAISPQQAPSTPQGRREQEQDFSFMFD